VTGVGEAICRRTDGSTPTFTIWARPPLFRGIIAKWNEEFSVERFRELLNVEKGKYRDYKNLNLRVIGPAVLEVNGLGEFGCKVEPVYKGRKVIALRLSWWTKNLEQKKAAFKELRVSRVGRRARLLGTVETVAAGTVPPPAELPKPGYSGLKEDQFKVMCRAFPGTDIQEMEKQFVAWNGEKGTTPENYTAALYGYVEPDPHAMVGIPARANTHTVIGNPIVLGRVRHLEPIFGLHRHVRADFIHLHRPHPFRVRRR
jgi:hypothetical protein